MIDQLSRLTMAQYIDIVCGNVSCLGIKDTTLAENTRRKLICDYASISDPAGTSSYLGRKKGESDDKATYLLFQICHNLLVMKDIEDVRFLLGEFGVNTSAMSDEQVVREVDSRMKRAKSMIERNIPEEGDDEPPKNAEEIRRMFDRQAASLMTYFKFQIDFNVIKATTFAYMIDQADREIKAKKAMLANI